MSDRVWITCVVLYAFTFGFLVGVAVGYFI